MSPFYLRIAIAAPLNRTFHYLPEDDCDMSHYQAGLRVSVPFGSRAMVGIIVGIDQHTDTPANKLKSIHRLIDSRPLLENDLYQLGHWLHQYYHQPLGECLPLLMPNLLRKGEPAQGSTQAYYEISDTLSEVDLGRAPRQLALYQHLKKHKGAWHKSLVEAGYTPAIMQGLLDKSIIHKLERPSFTAIQGTGQQAPLPLNEQQQQALWAINMAEFGAHLIEGITGSGKTEVYLQAIAQAVEHGKQILMLVPEIGLTAQTVQRFANRFDADILLLHSQLSDKQRLDAWLLAKAHNGKRAQIIIGTRSAVFTPLPNLAAIIIDEEQDASFKQQEGIRYHGRDVAVYRAKLRNVPVILGSATPSLDSLHNGLTQKYQHLRLTQRAGAASSPEIQILNIKKQPLQHGLADELLPQIQATLDKQQQVLVFVNRRGYAPTLYCPDCAWISECKRCDAKMTLHQKPPHLHCHHCDHKQSIPRQCPHCLSTQIQAMGAGTERLESHLQQQFSQHKTIRIDRDSTQKKDAMATLLQPVHDGEPCILVGTQMLAKGHHFPKVTLVIMINIDSGFFSADFRAMEKTAQLILQVAGRAGREENKGKAIIQTEFADHPLLHLLTEENYHALALALLEERHQQQLPPYGFQMLLRADSPHPKEAEQFLYRVRELFNWHAQQMQLPSIKLLGPLPSPMELRAGRFRSQLWLSCPNRKMLHHFLNHATQGIYDIKGFHKVRWSLDMDPADNI